MYLFNQIYHSYQGDVAQIQQQILQGRLYSFKRVLHAYSIPYVQTMFDCLRIYIKVHSTFFKLQYVSRGELPTPKGVILKIWFVVLQKYHIMHSEKWCAIVKDIFYMLTYAMCSSLKKTYCEKGIACARVLIFDIEVD